MIDKNNKKSQLHISTHPPHSTNKNQDVHRGFLLKTRHLHRVPLHDFSSATTWSPMTSAAFVMMRDVNLHRAQGVDDAAVKCLSLVTLD